MKELIELHGGRNLAAVSGNVDYLVAGEKMGPAKLKKAEKLGIRILTEEEFLHMVGEADAPSERISQTGLPEERPEPGLPRRPVPGRRRRGTCLRLRTRAGAFLNRAPARSAAASGRRRTHRTNNEKQ